MKKALSLKKRMRLGQKEGIYIPRIVVNHWLAANPKAVHKFLIRFYSHLTVFVLGFLCVAGEASAADTKTLVSAAEPAKLVSKEGEKQTQTPVERKKQEAVKTAAKTLKKEKKTVLLSVSEEDEKAEGKVYSLKGAVSGRNNVGLAVEYGEDPKLGMREGWFELNSKTALSGVKSLSELESGDLVTVTYKQLKDGSKRILKTVTLTGKAPKEALSAEAPDAGEEAGAEEKA